MVLSSYVLLFLYFFVGSLPKRYSNKLVHDLNITREKFRCDKFRCDKMNAKILFAEILTSPKLYHSETFYKTTPDSILSNVGSRKERKKRRIKVLKVNSPCISFVFMDCQSNYLCTFSYSSELISS